MPENTPKINVLVVDDEPMACVNLINLLIEFIGPEINITGIAYNTEDALTLLHEHTPDVVFLDIEMPNENAFQFLDKISPFSFELIFVTAYDEYALKAFKLNAVDYILKPIGISDLEAAIKKLKDKLRYKRQLAQEGSSYTDLLDQIRGKLKHQKIVLKTNNDVQVINFNNICFIEAQRSYSRFVFLNDNHIEELIVSNGLAEYEDLLPAEIFFRVHRSFLVNCMHIKKISGDDTCQLLLNGGHTVPVSRRRYNALVSFLEHNNFL